MRKSALAGAAALIGFFAAPPLGTGNAFAEDPPAATQEVSLDSMGAGAQSVFGSDGVI